MSGRCSLVNDMEQYGRWYILRKTARQDPLYTINQCQWESHNQSFKDVEMIKQMACYDAYQVGSAIEKWRIGNRADE